MFTGYNNDVSVINNGGDTWRSRNCGVTGLLWLVGEALGSGVSSSPSVGSMDAATGVKTYERYKPWGENRGSTTLPTRYQFTGQRREASLNGLYDYGARWYDSLAGVFLQPDSLVPDPYNPLDWNRYLYVRASPINFNDPSGHMQACATDVGNGCGGGSKTMNKLSSGRGYVPPTQTTTFTPTPSSTPTTTSTPSNTPTLTPTATYTVPPTSVIPRPMNTPTPPGDGYNSVPTIVPTLGPTLTSPKGIRVAVDWSKVDKIDLAIDIGGLIGNVAPGINVEIGGVVFVLSEVAEGAGAVKSVYDAVIGKPQNALLTGTNIVVDTLRLDISTGWAFNLLSIGLNLGPAISIR